MRKSELALGRKVRVRSVHPTRTLRGLEGVIVDMYRNPSGWTAVKVDLVGVVGLRTFQPNSLEVV